MASLSLQHINKTYPNGFEAVKDFNPEITRRAPLTMIASYLQMTLETLSRVRASIANAESK